MRSRWFVHGGETLLLGVLVSGLVAIRQPYPTPPPTLASHVASARRAVTALFRTAPEPEVAVPVAVPPARIDSWAGRFPGAARSLSGSDGGTVRTVRPEAYAQGVSFESGGNRVQQRLEGARAVPPEGEEYKRVLDGVDARIVSRRHGGEEFLRLSPESPASFNYAFELEGEGASFRTVGRSLLALDGTGRARLRLDPPCYWREGDRGAGRFPEVRLTTAGDREARLTIRIPQADRGRELLLDPGWSDASSMLWDRSYHALTVLADGRAMAVGGWSSDGDLHVLTSAEAFDPGTGAWVSLAPMGQGRAKHESTLLEDGRVLVTGGMDSGALDSSEIYDPAADSWTPTAPFRSGARLAHTATRLANGQVLVVGGDRTGTAERFDPAGDGGAGSWIPAARLAEPLSYHTATRLPDGRVLAAGGVNEETGEYKASSWIYDPSSDVWSPAGPLISPRAAHRAVLLPDGRALVAEGVSASRRVVVYTEAFDPATLSWSPAGAMATVAPGTPYRGLLSLTALPSGSLLATGGTLGDLCEIYDPDTRAWHRASPLVTPRQGHAAAILPDGTVLVAGGAASEGVPITHRAEIYDGGLRGASRPSRPSGPALLLPGEPGDFQSVSTGLQPGMALLFDWGDGTSSVSLTHAWGASGLYRVRGRVVDSDGAVSDWSEGAEVRVDLPPGTPSVPSGPDALLAGEEGTYAATATDPEGGAVTLTFDWGDGTSSVSPAHAWPEGTWAVRAMATDACGLSSGWSDALIVTVAAPEPPPPEPPSVAVVEVDLTPKKMNLRAQGPFTARIRASGIDPAGVTANGRSALRTKAEDGLFKARFDRAAVRDLGDGTGEVVIEGRLLDGRAFLGKAVVRLKDAKDRGKDPGDEDEWR